MQPARDPAARLLRVVRVIGVPFRAAILAAGHRCYVRWFPTLSKVHRTAELATMRAIPVGFVL